MIVYHGSNVIVDKPEIRMPSHGLDFGTGFYTTTNKQQAINFTYSVLKRNGFKGKRIVNIYEIDIEKAKQVLDYKDFGGITDEWFDFVDDNRYEKYTGKQYELIIGKVANDDVYATLQAYHDGLISKEVAMAELKVRDLYDQIVFANDNALTFLIYKGYEEVEQNAR